ncbi:MAG: hypothetical protein KAX11_05940, partial [Candidatus Aminicenantes bacterium]|nr:hypothetical protein [Candidatus Aminicenantes bacterium]
VRDLIVHPREKDLVVGSYGRGVWVTNISALQELTQEILDKDFFLFNIVDKPVSYTSQRARWGNFHMTGDAHIRTPNERSGLNIYYYIKEKRSRPLTLIIEDMDGNEKARLKTATTSGIHKIVWISQDRIPGTFQFTLTAGTFRFTLTDGSIKTVRKGTLKPRILWPVGNPDNYRTP